MLCRSIVENLIVKGGLPMSFVDSDGFRSFMSDVDPKFVPPCRQTVTYTYLPQLLSAKRVQMSEILATTDNVALTIDIWSDRRQHSYLGVTAHMFDVAKGAPHSMLLKFQAFRGAHSGENIARAVEDCINENSLQYKVHYVVTDNASNMKKAFSFVVSPGPQGNLESWLNDSSVAESPVTIEDSDAVLDDPSLYEDIDEDEFNENVIIGERVPCFAHSLQLAIRDGLQKVAVSRTAVAKCVKVANLTHQSAKFRAAYEDAFGTGRSIPTSNDTRWNSVFRQLSYIVHLDGSKLSDILRKEDHTGLLLTQKEIQQLRELVTILEPFSEATDIAQGSTYVTISCVVPVLLSLVQGLTEQLTSIKYNLPLVRELLRSLFCRFRGIFDQLCMSCSISGAGPMQHTERNKKQLDFNSSIYMAAASLDPEHGYRWLERHPGSVAEKEALKNKIFGKYQFS